MKSASGSLVTYLRTATAFFVADLWKIILANGTTLYWTSAATTIATSSGTYSAGPVIERGPIRTKVGLEVDSLEVTLKGPAIQILGLAMPQAAGNGALDGARVELRRIVMPTFGDTSKGDFIAFAGRVSTVNPSSTEVRLSIKSDLELLNVQMPRNVYQPGCSRTLFDSGCGKLRAAYQKTATVTGGDRYTVNTSLPDPGGWFDLGVITFTSGPNAGVSRTVKSFQSGTFTLALPLPYAAAGSITAVPGCDKTKSTCQSKFNNLAAFRGFPFVPKPETAR